ncbi:MAG: hypothetical protein ACE5IR_24110 [bacterium]
MNDTSPEIRAFLIRQFQRMSPLEKLEKASNMFATGRKFAEIAVKKQNNNLEGSDLKIAVFRWIYQNDISETDLDRIEERMRENANQ